MDAWCIKRTWQGTGMCSASISNNAMQESACQLAAMATGSCWKHSTQWRPPRQGAAATLQH